MVKFPSKSVIVDQVLSVLWAFYVHNQSKNRFVTSSAVDFAPQRLCRTFQNSSIIYIVLVPKFLTDTMKIVWYADATLKGEPSEYVEMFMQL